MGVVIAVQLPWLQREHRLAVRAVQARALGGPGHGHDVRFRLDAVHHPGTWRPFLAWRRAGAHWPGAKGCSWRTHLAWASRSLLTGLAFGRLSGALRFARIHSRAISVVSGALLAALGLLIITGEVGTISSWSSSVLQHIGLGGLATG